MKCIIYSQDGVTSNHLSHRWIFRLAAKKAITIQAHFGNANCVPAIISFIYLNKRKQWENLVLAFISVKKKQTLLSKLEIHLLGFKF